MKNFKTIIIALFLLTGSSFVLSSCEEEPVLPTDIDIRPSGDGTGMEDDEQWD